MASITDNRGFNQGFAETTTLTIRTLRRMRAITAEMDQSRFVRVLEIGCGTGLLSYLLASKINGHVIGIDLCRSFIDTAKQQYSRDNLTYAVIDLANTDAFNDIGSGFDYIIGNGILHHLGARLPTLLGQCKNMLGPGGKLIFWEPNWFNPFILLFFTFPLLRKCIKLEPQEIAFTKKSIIRIFRLAGFNAVRASYRDFLLPCTPAFLIKPLIIIGNFAEKIPVIKNLAQSIFVVAAW
jgi:2-polyprenyl-3-methyl-5-hydroxy-6-metoxy-1,4-benzoquinol methylase